MRVSSRGKIVVSPRELTFWFANMEVEEAGYCVWSVSKRLPIVTAWDGLEFL